VTAVGAVLFAAGELPELRSQRRLHRHLLEESSPRQIARNEAVDVCAMKTSKGRPVARLNGRAPSLRIVLDRNQSAIRRVILAPHTRDVSTN